MRPLVAALVSILIVAACGGSAGTTQDRAMIETTLTEFQFTPAAWELPAGKPVRIVIHNKGTLEHDFTIDSLKIAVKALPGKDTTKDFNVIAPGTYVVACSVAGHKEAGMHGTLTVK